MAEKRPIVVIGAGIVGVSTAIWLQRAGMDVCLIDREGPAAGTSFGNGGVLASSGIVPVTVPGLIAKAPGMLLNPNSPLFLRWSYVPQLLPWLFRYLSHAREDQVHRIADALTLILKDSLEQHQALAAGTPAEKFLKPSDYVFMYPDKTAFDGDGLGWAVRRDRGYSFDLMDADELGEYDPVYAGRFGFAVRLGDHGTISDPGRYVQALADHFVADGGTLQIATVTDLKIDDRDRIVAVETDAGSLACDGAVLSAGVWSTELANRLGVKVPMETERGYHIELVNPSLVPRSPVMVTAGKFVITPMDGRIRCAGIVEFGGLNKGPSRAPIELLKRHAQAALPDLTYDRIDEWMGHRPAPADSIPLIGAAPVVENAWMGFGHHHIGLTGGPITGRIIADLVAGKNSNQDLSPFLPGRFV